MQKSIDSLTQSRLKETFKYDPSTGYFIRIKACQGTKVGVNPEVPRLNGYSAIWVDGRYYLAHRLSWLYVYGQMPKEFIDHINGDRSDNRIVNLREANQYQNQYNSKKRVDNKSGFKGVVFVKNSNKWQANIRANGKRKHLGLFATPEDAHTAYCKASKSLHLEFANDGVA